MRSLLGVSAPGKRRPPNRSNYAQGSTNEDNHPRRACRLDRLSLAAAAFSSFATDDRDDHQRGTRFIGVFNPAFAGFEVNSPRCPESHPTLLKFVGTANTTLGAATIVQSHCEGQDRQSFRRGEQVITLASGWTLTGAYSGRLIPTPTTATDGLLIVQGRYRNTGGTGPYKHANGFGISAGTVDTRTGGAVITVSGTL